MSTRVRNIAILILSVLIFFWLKDLWKSEPQTHSHSKAPHSERIPAPPQPVPQAQPQALVPQVAPPPESTIALKPIANAAIATEKGRHKPPPGSVPYTYINGWVTAYGDILLGKPKDPNFPASGYIEAPLLNLWPEGIVPFSIHESVPNPERILRVIAYMNQFTPVRFVAYRGQPDSIVFFPMDGVCVSYLGKIGGNQPIYIDSRCSDHEITHEVMHALGFIHEHSRADRDQYVQVLWDNIEEDKQDQFDVTPPSLNEPMKDRPFDFNSVMIYSKSAFARQPGLNTLVPLSADRDLGPVSTGLSREDLERVRLLYGR